MPTLELAGNAIRINAATLKIRSNSYFVSNYSDAGLKSSQTNMETQTAFILMYKAVTYMCQYSLKTKDQCSQAMKQAMKEDFENIMHHHDTMKTISKAYSSSRECSVQEEAYHILPELKLWTIFLVIYFVKTNIPEQGVQILLSEKELSKLPENRPNISRN